MRVQAFSAAKDPDRPEANEDRFVVVPGRLYAAIDGVTDRTGRRYGDRTGGRLAAETVELALLALAAEEDFRSIDAKGLTQRLDRAFQAAYAKYGVLDAASTSDADRIGSTLALAVDRGDRFAFFLIGDSGVRLNGAETIVYDKDLDRITATLRGFAYRRVAAAGADATQTEIASRALCWRGTRAMPDDAKAWLTDSDLDAIRADTLARLTRELPHIPVADMTRLALDGIVGAQGGYQNRIDHPLGYACLDGFGPRPEAVETFERAKSAVSSIELYTDGYFALPDTPTLDAWEAKADEIERVDFAKIDAYASTKGSLGRLRADDRTVVIVSRGETA